MPQIPAIARVAPTSWVARLGTLRAMDSHSQTREGGFALIEASMSSERGAEYAEDRALAAREAGVRGLDVESVAYMGRNGWQAVDAGGAWVPLPLTNLAVRKK